ncbi:MAG: class I SAM-dependent methyltransferase [Pseudomonadota bacterium]
MESYALYSRIIPYYFKDRSSYGFSVNLVDKICKRELGKLDQVHALDMGAGFGAHAEMFAEKGYNVTAIELSTHMVNLFRERLKLSKPDIKQRISLFHDSWFNEDGDWNKSKSYQLIYFLGNTIWNTGNRNDLSRLLRNSYDLLVDGGLVVFDLDAFDDLEDNAELVWGKPVATDVPGTKFQSAFSKRRLGNDGELEVTLHVKWIENGIERIEKEKFQTFAFDSEVVEEIATQTGFQLIETLKPRKLYDPTTTIDQTMWILKKN